MVRPNTSAIIAAITTKASIAIAAMPPIGKRSSEDEGSVISGVVAMWIVELSPSECMVMEGGEGSTIGGIGFAHSTSRYWQSCLE